MMNFSAVVRAVAWCFAAALSLSFMTASLAAPGALDATFGGGNGYVTTPFIGISGNERANAVVVRPDGRILIAGGCTQSNGSRDVCLVQYLTSGATDSTFGPSANGRVVINRTGDDTANAIVLAPNGRAYVAATCGIETCVFAINPNGSLDTSFGAAGVTTFLIGGAASTARAIVRQFDGKLVIAGECFDANNVDVAFCIRRLLPTGSVDTSFGVGGTRNVMLVAPISKPAAMALQADGKILVAGSCQSSTSTLDFCMLRLTTNGALDTSGAAAFGDIVSGARSGKVLRTLAGSSDAPVAILVQPDDRIVLVGNCVTAQYAMCVVRYSTVGDIDTTYGFSGANNFQIAGAGSSIARAALLQPDGKLVIVASCNSDFCALRVNDDGASIDATFRAGGVIVPISDTQNPYAVAMQRDGKLLLAGECYNGLDFDVCVARLDGGSSAARSCSLDIDGDGAVLPTTDLLIMNRISRGVRTAAAIGGITFAPHAIRNNWAAIRDYLVNQCGVSLP